MKLLSKTNPFKLGVCRARALLILIAVPLSSIAKTNGAGPVDTPIDLNSYSDVYYVSQATGSDIVGDGSIEKPWASVISALEGAGFAKADSRAVILVSRGRYASPTFSLRPYVDLYGGFASPGGKRDIYAYSSILDGEDRHRILLGSDHSRLDGFRLSNGRVRGKGAALLCDGTSPIIANCIFENNRTLIPQNWDPPLIHETAHDGGAVMILNGAAPQIENNFFYRNSTECGRGGALAADRRSFPIIIANVFSNNTAGNYDPMRSSDGGAVSIFDWSGGVFKGNIVVANHSLTENDGGGVFIALWSSIDFVDNVVVGNHAGDDAGGLFIGGQEHRYGVPLDPFPPADQFSVLVKGNTFVGNKNPSENSGAMRITMESRVRLTNNIIAENEGGMYLQRSEITAVNNTVWQDYRFIEHKQGLGPSLLEGNILKGPVEEFDAPVTFKQNMGDPLFAGKDAIPVADVFVDDGIKGDIIDMSFDPTTNATTLKIGKKLPSGIQFQNRPIDVDDDWRVIKTASGKTIVFWGRLGADTNIPDEFEILRTFTLKKNAPAGIGAGAR
jgi:parallel beta-helix repeat protein